MRDTKRVPGPGALLRWVAVVLAALSGQAHAYTFVPGEHEWPTWPDYCKARYVVTNIGSTGTYRNKVDEATVEYWRRAIGPATFNHIHHYCAGRIWLQRFPGDYGHSRNFQLDQALSEMTYTYRNIPHTNPFLGVVVDGMATVLIEQGKTREAESLLMETIEEQPTREQPYVVAGIVFQRLGHNQRAVEVLTEGLERIGTPSAELYYVLGSVYANLEQYGNALTHAYQAYELGYPLPGLKDRLKRAGVWDR